MVTAKCNKCGGSAEGKTMQEARDRLNHAIGLSRGIKCGDNYGCVVEVKTKKPVEKPKVSTEEKPKIETVEKPITSKPESSKSTTKKSKYF